MSEFQKTMGRLQEMISRSNELVEIKKEAGKIAFQKGLEQGRVEGAIAELKRFKFALQEANNLYEINKFCLKEEKRLKVLGGKE